MRIVLIANNFPPVVDGVGDYTYWLSRELVRRGHEVHVICSRGVKADQSAGDIKVYPKIEQWTTRYYKIALEQIGQIQPDWVILQYVPYGFHAFGMPVSIVQFVRRIRRSGFRTFVFFHEVFIGFDSRALKATLVALTQTWIARRICRHADEVATSNDHYFNILQQWRKDIHQIPIGSNIPVGDAVRPANDTDDTFKIITFGLRDVDVLLAFFASLKQEVENVELIVCGKQKMSEEDVAVEHVHFTGYLPGREIAKWLVRADVFLLPDFVSKAGRGGTCMKSGSLAAAFAAGLPIVGMKGEMNDRLLREMEEVQLVDYHNFESWKSAVLNVYRRQDRPMQQRRSIRNFYERHLAWETIGDRYLKIINTMGS